MRLNFFTSRDIKNYRFHNFYIFKFLTCYIRNIQKYENSEILVFQDLKVSKFLRSRALKVPMCYSKFRNFRIAKVQKCQIKSFYFIFTFYIQRKASSASTYADPHC